jgi:ectoine hydroxylase-related dioxygenase (phytanoyl-CoA dioxygenase family)
MTVTEQSQPTLTRADDLSDDVVQGYRRQGFVHIPRVISAEDAARYAEAALGARQRIRSNTADAPQEKVFAQLLQLWQQDDVLRSLTLDPHLAAIATRLAGIPLRLWHDQTLIKDPHNGARTEFHQDGPYWPHANSRQALSAWVALVDVPVERGAMTFIPGSQKGHRKLPAQNLMDSDDLFSLAPDLRWERRITVPLRAGDCTFHDSFIAHAANANATDDPRIAHVVIYVDRDLTYRADARHVVTDPLGLADGSALPDDLFPPV